MSTKKGNVNQCLIEFNNNKGVNQAVPATIPASAGSDSYGYAGKRFSGVMEEAGIIDARNKGGALQKLVVSQAANQSAHTPVMSMKITKENIGSKLIEAVDARELHAFLGSGKDFSNWIKSRIEKYGFTEETDYITSSPKLASCNNQGLRASSSNLVSGENRRDYHVSINMAKELSMVERTAKGRVARLYFIDCEEKLKALTRTEQTVPVAFDPASVTRMQLINRMGEMVVMLQETEAERLALESKVKIVEHQVAVMQPVVDAFDRIAEASGSQCISDAAKNLQVNPRSLFQWMDANGWIFRRKVGGSWVAHQDKLVSRCLEHKAIARWNDETVIDIQVRVTTKGLTVLSRRFSVFPASDNSETLLRATQ